jgi:hypothetical protein
MSRNSAVVFKIRHNNLRIVLQIIEQPVAAEC